MRTDDDDDDDNYDDDDEEEEEEEEIYILGVVVRWVIAHLRYVLSLGYWYVILRSRVP